MPKSRFRIIKVLTIASSFLILSNIGESVFISLADGSGVSFVNPKATVVNLYEYFSITQAYAGSGGGGGSGGGRSSNSSSSDNNSRYTESESDGGDNRGEDSSEEAPRPVVDKVAPTIEIFYPEDGAVFGSGVETIDVVANAADNADANPTLTGAGTVTLKTGTNKITLTARDAAGNTATKTITVTRSDTTVVTPQPITTTPIANTTVGTAPLQATDFRNKPIPANWLAERKDKLDTDKDGIDDLTELSIGTDPYSRDTDDDGNSDKTEIINLLNPKGDGLLFIDLPQDYWAKDFIAKMYIDNVILGYSDGTFRPEKRVNRAEGIKMIIEAAGVPIKNGEAHKFSDVTASDWFYPYVQTAVKYGVINAAAKFNPGDQLTRAETIKMIVGILGGDNLKSKYAASPGFSDVNSLDWFSVYAEFARLNGITSGYADGTFGGSNSITRAQLTKMVALARDLQGRDNLVYAATLSDKRVNILKADQAAAKAEKERLVAVKRERAATAIAKRTTGRQTTRRKNQTAMTSSGSIPATQSSSAVATQQTTKKQQELKARQQTEAAIAAKKVAQATATRIAAEQAAAAKAARAAAARAAAAAAARATIVNTTTAAS